MSVPDLRVVDASTGELHECPSCGVLQDQFKELESELRGRRALIAQLKRDKEAWAVNHELWDTAEDCHRLWRSLTGHARSPFTVDRFEQALPYLKDDKYGEAMVRKAIAGIAFDPWTKRARNGALIRYDGWHQLCKNSDTFEQYVNKAPREAT